MISSQTAAMLNNNPLIRFSMVIRHERDYIFTHKFVFDGRKSTFLRVHKATFDGT